MARIPKPPRQRYKRCKVVTDQGYLVLTMPDGAIIPHQTKMILENNVDMPDVSMVTITVMADTKVIEDRGELTKKQKAEMLRKIKADYE